MRIYSAADEEALRARSLLKDWAAEGFITAGQYKLTEAEITCTLRRTNIFLRGVLFFFTLLIVAAATGLFLTVFFSQIDTPATGVFLWIVGALSYVAAELSVSRARLYRFGIEEALAACSVVMLCFGIQFVFFSNRPYSSTPNPAEFLIPTTGAIASIWIWHRFGLPYVQLAAMFFLIGLPAHWTSSAAAHRAIVVVFFASGLAAIAAIRRRYRSTYLDTRYSISEALLWLGIYLVINLQLPFVSLSGIWRATSASTDVSRPFYWTTFVLIWCLPPAMLARGIREKDRFVLAAGAILAILTLATNKPYLGWTRNTWDPMLLGALLIGVALFLRHWLTQGPGEVRRGFTAQRLSSKDKTTLTLGATAFSLASPNIIPPASHRPDVEFGGGKSGGGGASSGF